VEHLYFDATRGHLASYRRWLVPVHDGDAARESELAEAAAG
jgi:hypothetical protein